MGSRKPNEHIFYPMNLNYALMPNPNVEEHCNEIKQIYEGGQCYLAEDDRQEADHPSTFMKMIKSRTHVASSTKDQSNRVLPLRVI
jgi:hypothetical protein